MENPASWTEVELVIHRALMQAEKARAEMRVGGSQVIQISHALREAGYIAADAPSDPIGWERLLEVQAEADVVGHDVQTPLAEEDRP